MIRYSHRNNENKNQEKKNKYNLLDKVMELETLWGFDVKEKFLGG